MKKIPLIVLMFGALALHGQVPSQSASFTRVNGTNSINSSSLSMIYSKFGNFDHRTFTTFCFFKRYQFGAHTFFHAQGNGSKLADADWAFEFDINAQDRPAMLIFFSPTQFGRLTGNATCRDTNWHSIKFDVDLNNPVATNRTRITFDRVRLAPSGPVNHPNGILPVRQCPFPVSIGGNSTATNPANYYFPGKMVNMAFFSGRNPSIDELTTTNNKPKDIDTVPNLWSLVRGDGFPIEQDEVLNDPWTNKNVVYSGDVP